MVTDDYGQNPHIRGLQGPFCVEVTFQEIPKNHHITGLQGPFCVEVTFQEIPKNHHITGFPGPFCVEAIEDRQFGQVGVWTLDPPPLG